MNSSQQNFNYTGTELLEVGESALKNYNEGIVRKFIAKYGVLPDEAKVLDFGAGIGTLSVIFERLTKLKPATLEIDPKQRGELVQRGFSPFHSLAELPAGFDFIYTSNVLEHIDDDVEVLKELKGKLKGDGLLAIYVPAFELLWTELDNKVEHKRRYTIRSLTEKLQSAGFSVEESRYCDTVGFFLALIFKVLKSGASAPSLSSLYVFDRFLYPLNAIIDPFCSRFIGKNVLIFARPVFCENSLSK